MKTEYMFTAAQQAELDAIDRQMFELCKRKADIYATANCRYITETPEEFMSVERLKYLINNPVIPDEAIANIIFRKECTEHESGQSD